MTTVLFGRLTEESVPEWLGRKADEHSQPDAKEGKARLLDTEAVDIHEDDGKRLEGQIKDSEKESGPNVQSEGHTV